MKKSIFYLGIALVTFTNVISALGQQSRNEESLTQIVHSNENSEGNVQGSDVTERKSNMDGNQARFEPATIELPTYQKTMTEIIAENRLIIEDTIPFEDTKEESTATASPQNFSIDFYPPTNEKTIEETILQDMQITDSPVIDFIQPTTLKKSRKL